MGKLLFTCLRVRCLCRGWVRFLSHTVLFSHKNLADGWYYGLFIFSFRTPLVWLGFYFFIAPDF